MRAYRQQCRFADERLHRGPDSPCAELWHILAEETTRKRATGRRGPTGSIGIELGCIQLGRKCSTPTYATPPEAHPTSSDQSETVVTLKADCPSIGMEPTTVDLRNGKWPENRPLPLLRVLMSQGVLHARLKNIAYACMKGGTESNTT